MDLNLYIDTFPTCEKTYPYMENKNRVFVMGDIHGDYDALIRGLQIGKVIDIKENWIAGDAVFIQLGDVLDDNRPGINNAITDFKGNYMNFDQIAEFREVADTVEV